MLDGDRLERIARFPTRYALHGGPKFTADGRYVFFASRDGWIAKYDLWNLETVAEVRAGLNTRNIAVSGDGQWVIAGNYLPHTLVVLDARDLTLVKLIPVADRSGAIVARVGRVRRGAARQLRRRAEGHPRGVGAALRTERGAGLRGPRPRLSPGRGHRGEGAVSACAGSCSTTCSTTSSSTADYDHLIGASREAGKGQVVNLNVRRKIATVDLPGLPHLGSGITWERDGRPVLATTNLREGVVSVIDMKQWKTVAAIGPTDRASSCAATRTRPMRGSTR